MHSVNKSKKYNLRKAYFRTSRKINNLIKDLHRTIAVFLCSNYHKILIPKLNFHALKNLDRSVKRHLASLRECEFVDYLTEKAKDYGSEVLCVTEEFTSKTCSCCGNLNQNLGVSKVYNCRKCNSVFDRDVNGSRNILSKYLTDTMKK